MLKYSLFGMCMAQYQVVGLRADGGGAAGAHVVDMESDFWQACRNGDEERVRELLQNGIDPNHVTSPDGTSVLYWAVNNGRNGVVRMLVQEFGVDPNGDPARDPRSPLYTAISNGHELLVRMLVEEFGADPSGDPARDPCTPLYTAISNGHEGIARMLVEEFDNVMLNITF